MKKKTSSCITGALVFAAMLCAHSPELKLYEAVEPHMGTMFEVKLYSSDAALAKKGFQLAFARVAELDNELSDYKPDSELNIATMAAASGPVRVSKDLATVLEAAQKLSEETGGAFDVTVGPLTKLWRQARKEHRVPSTESVLAAREKCGYRKLHVNGDSIRVDSPGMQLDLGAIAKGYAADEALKVLAGLGLHQALVAASGDLAFGDAPPGQKGWKIGVDSSDQVLVLANAAVSTSGASEQFLESGTKHYSHIIDPKTGMGLLDAITVTTVARRGLLADPAATAVSVLGCEKGLAFIESQPGLAAFISEKQDGRLKTIESSRFKQLRD